MANNASLSWARVDDDIFNRYLRGAQLRSICFSCNNYGHLSTNCPLRTARARQDTLTNVSPPPPSDSSRSIVNNNSFSTTSNQPFRAPPPPPPPSDSVINLHNMFVDSIIVVNAHMPTVDTCTDAEFVLGPTHNLPAPSKRTSDFFPLPNTVVSPINVPVLKQFLINHPDTNFVNFLLDGFTYGFSVGYDGPLTAGQSRNLLSARQNPIAVSAAILKEVSRGHTAGPFPVSPFPMLHWSPLGAVPKKDDTHRIILDLSSPRGSSINQGISSDIYSVKYSSFDDAVSMVLSVGSSCFMAKLDIKHAFHVSSASIRLAFTWLRLAEQLFR